MKNTIKKILCTALVVVMCLSSAPLQGLVGLEWSLPDLSVKASATDVYDDGSFQYTVSYGEATLTRYYDDKSKVVIPATLGGYPVTAIGDSAFSWCEYITSVTVPNTVKSIGASAFYDCYNLTSINIPSSVTTIGASAFYSCGNLTSINIPSSVTSIGDSAFYNCSSLTSITLPDSITTIGASAFYDCYNLTSINIPSSVTTIGDSAFYWCYGLTSITIPDSVTTIGKEAFKYCHDLKTVSIGKGVTSIGENAFYNCSNITGVTVSADNTAYSNDASGALFNKDKTVLIMYPAANNAKSYSIPEGVVTVSDNAFYNSDFESIIIPDSVTTIGENAFQSCYYLNSVSIGKGLASIGKFAFAGCNKLESLTVDAENACFTAVDNVIFSKDKTELVLSADYSAEAYVIPSYVTKIGSYAFYSHSNLKSITIPENVKVIGDSAFLECYNLESVTIGNGVTAIGNSAFKSCSALKNVTLGNSVQTIGDSAFYNYGNLQSITVPDSVTSIGYDAFPSDTIIYCNKGSYSHSYAVEKDCHYYLINGTAEDNTARGEIDGISWTLYKTSGMLEFSGSGEMPYTEPWNDPYWRKHSVFVSYVRISEGITKISNDAFRNFKKLRSVALPASVTEIGEYAFVYCNALESFTIDKNNTAFSTDSYGALYNKDKTELIIGPKAVTDYVIPQGVTKIHKEAFCNNENLISITIPSSVTEIGEDAFDGCHSLEKVNITDLSKWCEINFETYMSNPFAVTYSTFEQTTGLYLNNTRVEDMVIPEGTTKINKYAFLGYNYLFSVKIPASVTEIGEMAFTLCTYLSDIIVDEDNAYFSTDEEGVLFDKNKTKLIHCPINFGVRTYDELAIIFATTKVIDLFREYTVPDTVKEIEPCAFTYNYFLYKVTLPEGLETIKTRSFMALPYLYSIRIPGSVKKIENNVFQEAIASVEICEGVTEIGDDAFINTPLQNVIIPSSVTKIGRDAFDNYSDELLDVYYAGTEEQWDAIEKESNNALLRANIHFNYSCPGHVYEEEMIEGVECAAGFKKYTCNCGWYYYSVFKGDQSLHTQTDWIDQEVSCGAEGIRYRECTTCGLVTEYEYFIGDHDYEAVVTAPTCTAQGYTTYTCSCGHSETGDYVSATGHSYSSTVVKAATHLEEGLAAYTCATCGNSYTAPIEKLKEHNYNTVLNIVAPSCESEGYTVYSCECGIVNNGDKKPATGHNYQGDTCNDCGKHKSAGCSCNCHKSGFMGFIWKIMNFFNKIFGSNKTCACGVSHY